MQTDTTILPVNTPMTRTERLLRGQFEDRELKYWDDWVRLTSEHLTHGDEDMAGWGAGRRGVRVRSVISQQPTPELWLGVLAGPRSQEEVNPAKTLYHCYTDSTDWMWLIISSLRFKLVLQNRTGWRLLVFECFQLNIVHIVLLGLKCCLCKLDFI